jgi:hypothetical protein
MASIEESRRPVVSHFVLDYLRLQSGPVSGVLLVCAPFCSDPACIFHVLHIVKTMVSAPITYVINKLA